MAAVGVVGSVDELTDGTVRMADAATGGGNRFMSKSRLHLFGGADVVFRSCIAGQLP